MIFQRVESRAIIVISFCIILLPYAAAVRAQPASVSAPDGRSWPGDLPATSIFQAGEMAAASANGMANDAIPYESMTSIPQKTLTYTPDYPVPTRKVYYQTVQLLKISWPDWKRHDHDDFATKLIVGLNKPYYRLKKDIRVLGSFDVKLENIILGFFNSANVTLKYDLRKLQRDEHSKVEILVEKVTFKIGIPF